MGTLADFFGSFGAAFSAALEANEDILNCSQVSCIKVEEGQGKRELKAWFFKGFL